MLSGVAITGNMGVVLIIAFFITYIHICTETLNIENTFSFGAKTDFFTPN
jgi:hypothetical protein